MNRIRRHIENSMTRTNCSPGLALFILLLLTAMLVYHYRYVALMAALYTLGAVVAAAVLFGVVLAVVALHRARATQAPAMPAVPAQEAATMEQEADALAHPDLTLAMSPSGEIVQSDPAH